MWLLADELHFISVEVEERLSIRGIVKYLLQRETLRSANFDDHSTVGDLCRQGFHEAKTG